MAGRGGGGDGRAGGSRTGADSDLVAAVTGARGSLVAVLVPSGSRQCDGSAVRPHVTSGARGAVFRVTGGQSAARGLPETVSVQVRPPAAPQQATQRLS